MSAAAADGLKRAEYAKQVATGVLHLVESSCSDVADAAADSGLARACGLLLLLLLLTAVCCRLAIRSSQHVSSAVLLAPPASALLSLLSTRRVALRCVVAAVPV